MIFCNAFHSISDPPIPFHFTIYLDRQYSIAYLYSHTPKQYSRVHMTGTNTPSLLPGRPLPVCLCTPWQLRRFVSDILYFSF